MESTQIGSVFNAGLYGRSHGAPKAVNRVFAARFEARRLGQVSDAGRQGQIE